MCDALRAVDVAGVARLGRDLGRRLLAGHRLLAAGNGGSAAQAQHLTAELVGRFKQERPALSAIALHAETSTVTALANDYGVEEIFARQVEAHGRPGDVLVVLSTSGRSPNLVRAAEAGHTRGMSVWSLTGRSPNPLASTSDLAVSVASTDTAVIQEVHQVLVHVLCDAVDREVVAALALGSAGRPAGAASAAGAGSPEGRS
ncbi:MAG: SIS domain-containing protein [Actinobacteria bacterium]|nr:SIS domain-containing protein [Actinomycetota bacterium]